MITGFLQTSQSYSHFTHTTQNGAGSKKPQSSRCIARKKPKSLYLDKVIIDTERRF